MIVIVIPLLLRKKFLGVSLWPFIVLRNKELVEDKVLMNHERIHLRQQVELLVIPFFLWYGIEFVFRIIQYQNHHLAYRNISFEREAYKNEKDLEYLMKRSFYKFLKYV